MLVRRELPMFPGKSAECSQDDVIMTRTTDGVFTAASSSVVTIDIVGSIIPIS